MKRPPPPKKSKKKRPPPSAKSPLGAAVRDQRYTEPEGEFADTERKLGMMLAVAVPLWIHRMREKTPEERIEIAHECGQIVAEKGDQLMFKGKETAMVFNALARGIACLAFAPGGVKQFGTHWRAR